MSTGKNNNTISSSSSSLSSSNPLESIATSSNIMRPDAGGQIELNEKLLKATYRIEENLTLVKDLIKQGANPNAVNTGRNTPLHYAALHGNTKTAKLLLQNNANPLAVGQDGSTPLHYAANYGRTETAIVLLQNGANPNAVDDGDNTPLHDAARYGHTETAMVLLQNGANPSAKNNYGVTTFNFAKNKDIRSFLTKCIDFQKELKPIFDKMVESFSKIRAERNGKEEASASSPSTDLDETLKAAKNKFLKDIDLPSINSALFPSGFNPLNMALDERGHSVLHLIANEALKLGDGAKRKQYLGLLATLAKESGSEKIQEMIKRATTISEGLRPSVASNIEEIIVSYLHDNEIERKKERAPTSQIIAERIMSYSDDKDPIIPKILEKILSNTNTPKTNIDDNLATALHLAANKGRLFKFSDSSKAELNLSSQSISSSSGSTSSGSEEEEKSAPAARSNNTDNQMPATFIQNPSAAATSSKYQQNQQ